MRCQHSTHSNFMFVFATMLFKDFTELRLRSRREFQVQKRQFCMFLHASMA